MKILPLLILALAVVIRVFDPAPVEQLRLAAFDQLQKLEPRPYTALPVRIVDIDEKSLAALGQWPWPRTVIADILVKLESAGAAAVAFDVLFAEPDRTSPKKIINKWRGYLETSQNEELKVLAEELPDHDEVLAASLQRLPTVLGVMFDNTGVIPEMPKPKWSYAKHGKDPRDFLQTYTGAVKALEILSAKTAGLGSINSTLDNDGLIRRVPLFVRLRTKGNFSSEVFPTLSGRSVKGCHKEHQRTCCDHPARAGDESFGENIGLQEIRVGRIKVPTTGAGQIWLHDTGHVPERFISAIDVIESQSLGPKIRGNIVLVGTSASGLKDIRSTPLDPAIAGVEVHAMAIEQMILGSHLTRPNWMPGAELIWLVVLGVILSFLIPRWGASWCALIAIGGLLISVGASWFAYTDASLLVDPVYPALVIILLYVVGSFIAFLRTESEKKYVRGAFSRYLSPELVEQLAADPDFTYVGWRDQGDDDIIFGYPWFYSDLRKHETPLN